MHILLIGNGGREHAIAWKLARSSRLTRLSVAPGNPGTAREPKTTNVALEVTDIAAVTSFARDNDVALAVIGPEAPLVSGLADALRKAGIPTVGPGADGAALEGSKAHAKAFMARHAIPTAAYGSFTSETEALAMIESEGVPIVIKADGLAAGKGVVVAHDLEVARAAVRDMLSGSRHGEAGHRVVIESFLAGEEASFIALIDGNTALPFATSQDHKARDEGDTGPNTGGMGAYSPAPVVTPLPETSPVSRLNGQRILPLALCSRRVTIRRAPVAVQPSPVCKKLRLRAARSFMPVRQNRTVSW